MMRRRALLAASQTGGGGKMVNHGVAVIKQSSKSVDIQLRFEFPCASAILVTVYTDFSSGHFGVTQGYNYSQGNFIGRFVSLSFSPQEDDTYIYEIVIEQ